MSLPYFPMYPTDFEAKTSHLTLVEDGAYNRLLRIMWMTPGCSLPDNDQWIMRRMRVPENILREVVRPIIGEFMICKNGRIFNHRLSEEWEKVSLTYIRRSNAGKKGGRPNVSDIAAKKQKAGLSRDKAGLSDTRGRPEPEPEPEPLVKRDTGVSPKKRATRLPDDWVLSKEYGRWALGNGFSEIQVRFEAEKFRDYWVGVGGQKGTKRDWLATWRNWMRNSGKQNGKQTNDERAAKVATDAFVEQNALATAIAISRRQSRT